MRMAFGTSAYRRDSAGLPELQVVNAIAEAAPTANGSVILLARPGMETTAELGSGPINGLYRAEGVLDGDLVAISGLEVYRGAEGIGLIGGGGPSRFAGSALELLATRGGDIFRTTGADGAAVSFPDGANVRAVAFLAGLFVAARADGHRFYWSAVLDGSTWDGADFASAESSPDELRDIVVVGDELCLLGDSTVEFWVPTGDGAIPFIRSQGRLYRKGVISTGCAAEVDNALFWVAPDFIVYRGGQVPERVSDNGIEERIKASASVVAFPLEWEGHKMFVVSTDSGAFAFDVSTRQWSRFKSYGREDWAITSAAHVDGQPRLGSALTGKVYEFANDDDDGEAREVLWNAVQPIDAPGVIDSIELEANVGRTQLLTGLGSAPSVEMRSSADQGATFTNWRTAELGRQGEYRKRTEWRRCGMFDAPCAVFEFRVTEAVPLRISGVIANGAKGGRARP